MWIRENFRARLTQSQGRKSQPKSQKTVEWKFCIKKTHVYKHNRQIAEK